MNVLSSTDVLVIFTDIPSFWVAMIRESLSCMLRNEFSRGKIEFVGGGKAELE